MMNLTPPGAGVDQEEMAGAPLVRGTLPASPMRGSEG